jgi:hypothetical protein
MRRDESSHARLARAFAACPDAAREVLAWLDRCRLRGRGGRLTLVIEADKEGEIDAVEVPKRFTRGLANRMLNSD